jgi:aldehyde dehydrogenase (NAD+)
MPLSFRKKQLVRLYDMINENRQWITDALKSDLGKPASETGLELEVYLSDVVHHLNHLDEWAADEKVSAHFPFNLDTNLIQKEPLGVVCNISPWNYPVVLTLNPVRCSSIV